MVNLYKSIVLFSYLVYVLVFFIPYLDPYLYEQETRGVLSWTGYGALIELHNSVSYIFLIAYSIALYGMIQFRAWARPLFVTLTVMSIISNGVQGINVFTAIDSVLTYLTNLADGATIVLMYLTSVSNKFKKYT